MTQMTIREFTETWIYCAAIIGMVGFAYAASWLAFRIVDRRTKRGKGH